MNGKNSLRFKKPDGLANGHRGLQGVWDDYRCELGRGFFRRSKRWSVQEPDLRLSYFLCFSLPQIVSFFHVLSFLDKARRVQQSVSCQGVLDWSAFVTSSQWIPIYLLLYLSNEKGQCPPLTHKSNTLQKALSTHLLCLIHHFSRALPPTKVLLLHWFVTIHDLPIDRLTDRRTM